jgi:hypothetical protein
MREKQTGSETVAVFNVFSYMESIRKKLAGLVGDLLGTGWGLAGRLSGSSF